MVPFFIPGHLQCGGISGKRRLHGSVAPEESVDFTNQVEAELRSAFVNHKLKETKRREFAYYNKMNKGTVKFFNEARGFGFIKGENGEEIFVQATGLIDQIRENDQVSYDTKSGRMGMNAINVARIL